MSTLSDPLYAGDPGEVTLRYRASTPLDPTIGQDARRGSESPAQGARVKQRHPWYLYHETEGVNRSCNPIHLLPGVGFVAYVHKRRGSLSLSLSSLVSQNPRANKLARLGVGRRRVSERSQAGLRKDPLWVRVARVAKWYWTDTREPEDLFQDNRLVYFVIISDVPDDLSPWYSNTRRATGPSEGRGQIDSGGNRIHCGNRLRSNDSYNTRWSCSFHDQMGDGGPSERCELFFPPFQVQCVLKSVRGDTTSILYMGVVPTEHLPNRRAQAIHAQPEWWKNERTRSIFLANDWEVEGRGWSEGTSVQSPKTTYGSNDSVQLASANRGVRLRPFRTVTMMSDCLSRKAIF